MVHVKESHLFNRFAILLVEHQLPASLGHKDVVIGQYSHLRGLKELTGNQLLFHETLRIGRKLCLHVAIIELQVLANGILDATQYHLEVQGVTERRFRMPQGGIKRPAAIILVIPNHRMFLAVIATLITIFIYRYQYRSEEHTSELQSLMRISYAVFCLKKKKTTPKIIYLL